MDCLDKELETDYKSLNDARTRIEDENALLDKKISFYTKLGAISIFVGVASMVIPFLPENLVGSNLDYFGDFVGGIVSSLWSLAGLLYIYVAFLGQKQQLLNQQIELKQNQYEVKATRLEVRGQREQMEIQNATIKMQRFESTFFNIINNHNKLVDSLTYKEDTQRSSKTERGRLVFDSIFKELLGESQLVSMNVGSMTIVELTFFSSLYSKTINKNNSLASLSHYFQSLVSILDLIRTSPLLRDQNSHQERENRSLYFEIFLSTQSVTEKSIIYYHIVFGWLVSEINDYRSKLRLVEKDFSIYRNSNSVYLNTENNSQMHLIDKFFELHLSIQ